MHTPSPNGTSGGASGGRSSGRTSRGRFANGNLGGPGNPLAGRANQLRARLIERMSEGGGIGELISYLYDIAGDKKAHPMARIAAIRELLDRSVGKAGAVPVEAPKPQPTALEMAQRLEALGVPREKLPFALRMAITKHAEARDAGAGDAASPG